MQEALAQFCEKGTGEILKATRQSLERAIAKFGIDAKVCFPETNYYLPLVNAFLKIEVRCLKDLFLALNEISKPDLFIYHQGLLNDGLLVLLCEEVNAALAVLNREHPKEGSGFLPDSTLRSLSLKLIDGRISAIAVILGQAKNGVSAFNLIRDFQSKGVMCFLSGGINGSTLERQLKSRGVELGLENYILSLGSDFLSMIYAFNFIVRAPLIYGGINPGQWQRITDYVRRHIPVFTLILGEAQERVLAAVSGGLVFGAPVISDSEIPRLDRAETTLFEAAVTQKDYKKIPSQCMHTRGVKVKVLKLDIPVAYSAAFEGERVKMEQLGFELGGKSGLSLELLSSRDEDDVEDGNIELTGPDISQADFGSRFLPLAIIVDVYGRKMQKDFEPVLERQLHRFINYALGLVHEGQRGISSIRISRDSFLKGFRLKHIGLILYAMLHKEYGEILDKVQVRLYTRKEDVQRMIAMAKDVFAVRDERLKGVVDESVDTYYSCLICQSFAPDHVCIITPERPGLCGAYSWFDAKTSSEVISFGWNQPILKGEPLDNILGQWDSVNRFVEDKSNRRIKRVSLYSLMDNPQSSCGFFECIVAVVPEVNGVMVVDRDYAGMTPSGMDFPALSNLIKGAIQVPGFLGIARKYILSSKFILPEGGLRRLVWMPKGLKESLGGSLRKAAEDIGEPDLLEKIADEEVATTPDALLIFLKKSGHPAIFMDSLI